MADRENERVAERETGALKKLQALAGVAEKGTTERLDWMYEQSQAQKTDMELMNTAVGSSADKDIADVKSLQTCTAGSLFLKGSATRTTEDTLRKLREDPLFQIRREEQAARESMMQNPLVMARIKKKMEKGSKKDKKKAKKAAKKEKKAMKKAKKIAKKAGKKSSSSSSSSSADSGGPTAVARAPAAREGSPDRRPPKKEELDLKALGPPQLQVNKREERAARVAAGKEQALASRGAPKRMDEDEKRRRIEQMQSDAKTHVASTNQRLEIAEKKQKETDDREAKNRAQSDQKYFKEMREQAYMQDDASMADRLKNQRHRRQKGIVDSLEKDDR